MLIGVLAVNALLIELLGWVISGGLLFWERRSRSATATTSVGWSSACPRP